MAEAYECDRCGGLNSGSPDTALRVADGFERRNGHEKRAREHPVGFHEVSTTEADLCPSCRNDLRKWYVDGGGDASDIARDES